MDPVSILNAAIAGIDAILNIVNSIRGQAGMTDDAILTAAQAETVTNQSQITQLLSTLPPKS